MPIIDCMTQVGIWPTSPGELSPSALAGAMQSRGVARAVAAHTSAIFYDAAAGNRTIEEMTRQSSIVLPAAVLDPRRYPACVEEAKRARAVGVVCFRFFPGLHDYPFSEAVFALRETLAALNG